MVSAVYLSGLLMCNQMNLQTPNHKAACLCACQLMSLSV